MKRFALALLFAVTACGAAQAQSSTRAQAQAVTSCGGQSLTAGVFYPVTQDLTGTLCTASGGGGSTSVTQGTVPWVISGQGTAGTPATGVVTVQGITSMVPFNITLPAETTKVIGTVNQGTNPWLVNTQGAVGVTLTDCSGTITSGATAQNAFTAAATRHGFTIANIDTTEPLWISFTTTAAASGTGSYPLAQADATTFANLSSFTSPQGMGINTALSVIAATTSHKYTCTVW